MASVVALTACGHPPPPVSPGPPIPAQDELVVDTFDKECTALIAALASYGECTNLDDGMRAWVHSFIEYAQQSFDAGKKGLALHPDRDGEHVMARNCRQAAISIGHAHERCNAGPEPHVDY